MKISNYVLSFINQTQRNIFLTGKAGTGKTTLLHQIVSSTHKNAMVVAPTGIAALNAKGVTIHSLFQLPFASFLPAFTSPPFIEGVIRFENRHSLQKHFKMHRNKRRLIQNLELLIVDEVSMLRADVLDAMDYMLQYVRKNKNPFGGVQMLFIGDLLQLPPVVKNEEWDILKEYYHSIFFFHSKVIEQNPLLYIELEKVYRQSDELFLNILNNLRNNLITCEDINALNKYVHTDFKPNNKDGYITLTTHNNKADKINKEALDKLPEKQFEYQADIIGDFPEYMYPVEKILSLKKGAQVIFIKNDPSGEKLFYNGKIGTIVSLSEEEILVELANEEKIIEVQKYEWQNIRYYSDTNTNEIKEEVLGTFTHYPLRTAWAITIHKSQGLTFDKAIIDIESTFAPGQAYVALSRLRSFDGLILCKQLSNNNLQTSTDIKNFAKNKIDKEFLDREFSIEKRKFLERSIIVSFSWEEIVQKWNIHVQSYKSESERSNKSKFYNWANKQLTKWTEILALSEKFIRQLQQILAQKDYQWEYLYERFEKAKEYFFPILDEITYHVFRVQSEISSSKNVKQFREELSDLGELQLSVILQLLKTDMLLNIYLKENAESKKTELLHKIKTYKVDLLQKIFEELKLEQLDIQEEKSLSTKNKEEKISSHDKTWELWKKQISIEAIASERKLSLTTIYSHLGTLIKQRKILISELLSRKSITELTKIFEKIGQDTSLTQIKEQVGDKYSWEELRLFKNSLLSKKD